MTNNVQNIQQEKEYPWNEATHWEGRSDYEPTGGATLPQTPTQRRAVGVEGGHEPVTEWKMLETPRARTSCRMQRQASYA